MPFYVCLCNVLLIFICIIDITKTFKINYEYPKLWFCLILSHLYYIALASGKKKKSKQCKYIWLF